MADTTVGTGFDAAKDMTITEGLTQIYIHLTVSKPFSFTLVHGPYEVPASPNFGTGGMYPVRQMILISFAGDDSQRYCDVYQSQRDQKWYIFNDSWQHLVAGAKAAQVVY